MFLFCSVLSTGDGTSTEDFGSPSPVTVPVLGFGCPSPDAVPVLGFGSPSPVAVPVLGFGCPSPVTVPVSCEGAGRDSLPITSFNLSSAVALSTGVTPASLL